MSKSKIEAFLKNGYTIIRNVISKEDCQKTIVAIEDFLSVDFCDNTSWYSDHPAKHGVMIEFFKHDQLEQNRFSKKLWVANEALLGTSSLWVSTDRVGLNPPETEFWKFPGPNLHLDASPTVPFPFGLQGILYLTDTEPNQGTLTVVPGFHKTVNSWLAQFPENQIPLIDVFDEFESKPIAAEGGDMIIWHRGLPHGSSPNRNTKPRIVQYINMYPPEFFSV